jgi:hypothetical protein
MAVAGGAEFDPLTRFGAVGGDRETLIPCRDQLDRPARPLSGAGYVGGIGGGGVQITRHEAIVTLRVIPETPLHRPTTETMLLKRHRSLEGLQR